MNPILHNCRGHFDIVRQLEMSSFQGYKLPFFFVVTHLVGCERWARHVGCTSFITKLTSHYVCAIANASLFLQAFPYRFSQTSSMNWKLDVSDRLLSTNLVFGLCVLNFNLIGFRSRALCSCFHFEYSSVR